MARKMEANQLYLIEIPSPEELLAMDLASALQFERDPKARVVSYECQETAVQLINELGFDGALEELHKLTTRYNQKHLN